MAGLECIGSVKENFNSHDIILQDTQDSIDNLRELVLVPDEAFNELYKELDEAFTDRTFDSYYDVVNFVFEIIRIFLWRQGYDLDETNTINEVDNIFKAHGIAPILSSTAIIQNDEGKYFLTGAINKLTCKRLVNTNDFTPQGLFTFSEVVTIPMYGEILYKFGNEGRRFASVNNSLLEVYIMSGVIFEEHKDQTDETQQAHVDVVLANELGHLQFHKIIVPQYGITINSVFGYKGTEYTFQQVDELWSDYSSFLKAFDISQNLGNLDIVNFELTRIAFRTKGLPQYDLTRSVFKDLLTQGLELADFFQELEKQIVTILESAKN